MVRHDLAASQIVRTLALDAISLGGGKRHNWRNRILRHTLHRLSRYPVMDAIEICTGKLYFGTSAHSTTVLRLLLQTQ